MLSQFCSREPKEGPNMFLQNVVSFLPDNTVSHHKTQYSQIIQLLNTGDKQPYFPLQLGSRISMSYRISYDLF